MKRQINVFIAATFMVLWVCGSAFAADPVVTPGQKGIYEIYRFQLDGFPQRKNAVAMITVVGGEVSHLAIAHKGLRVSPFWHDTQIDQKGNIGIRVWVSGSHAQRYNFVPMTLSIERDGKKLQGTWKLLVSKWVPRFTSQSQMKDLLYSGSVNKSPRDLSGAIVGQVVTEAELAKANAVPKDALWDNYLGPNENSSSGGTNQPDIVTNLSKARIVWRSPFIGGVEIKQRIFDIPNFGRPPAGGGAAPLLINGKIIQYHFRPSGELRYSSGSAAVDNWKDKGAVKWQPLGVTREEYERNIRILADDVVTCMDAATGRVLWETVFPQEAFNIFIHKGSVNNLTPAVDKDTIYVLGNRGELRAINLSNGQVRWRKRVDSFHNTYKKVIEKQLDAARSGKVIPPPYISRKFNAGLTVADGVVIVPSTPAGGAAIAYDTRSGKQLWKGGWLSPGGTPLVARFGKKSLLLVNSQTGVTAFDPRSVKKLWQVQLTLPKGNAKDESCAMALDHDILLTAGGGYRISLTGAEHLYHLPGFVDSMHIATVSDGVALVRTGKQRSKEDPPTIYRIDTKTGRVLSRHGQLAKAREGPIAFAMSGQFFMEKIISGGHAWSLLPVSVPDQQVGPAVSPPFWLSSTYRLPVASALADGRIWIRSSEGLYCLDLRAKCKSARMKGCQS